MPKRNRGEEPDFRQRVADCDKFHMPFDSVAREFYAHLTEAAATGSEVAFEPFFQNIEKAQQHALLAEIYDNLEPRAKLELIEQYLGKVSIKTFLEALTAAAPNEEALLKVKAEAKACGYFHPAAVPKDAEIVVYMAEQSRVGDCATWEEAAELPYDRMLSLRSLGGGWFRVLAEEYGEGLEPSKDEKYGVNDRIQFGAPFKEDGKRVMEPLCRHGEGVAVTRSDKKVVFLDLAPEGEDPPQPIHVVVTNVTLNGQTILP